MKRIREERAKRTIEREREEVERNADAIRARCTSLYGFIKEAWHVLEPVKVFVGNWHLQAICEHLEAITYGRFLAMGLPNYILMNVPPGTMKSLSVSVMWQAWEWGPAGMPETRYLATSYNDGPSTRDSRKCRDLILSEWYQSLWPEVVLKRAGETSFENTRTGFREGSAFKSLTSKRADRLIIDDPHSTETAESDLERDATTRKFREGALNRLNDQATSAIVVIMQRLHSKDVSGVILEQNMGFIHLCLPMRFEPKRRCSTPLGFTDPRKNDGELLDPVRFPAAVVDKLESDMGSYAFTGQYQQSPTKREGNMFKRDWFADKIIRPEAVPAGTKWVRHWDLAATKDKTAARTAGVKLGRTPDGRYIVGNVVKTREEGDAVRRLVKATAQIDGVDVAISLPQDPGQAGKVQSQDYVLMLSGFNARARIESGDKETRAEPFSAQCEAGNVYLCEGPWVEDYLDELCQFPGGKFADQVDASSGAFGRLLGKDDGGWYVGN